MADFQQTIQSIAQIIPGYAGYQSKERRRDADKILRERLATQYAKERLAITRLAQAASRGHLEYVDDIESIGQSLDRFIARLQTAPRGYAGWFDAAQIQEADLDQLYQFDASLADGAEQITEKIAPVNAALKSGAGIDDALDALRGVADALNTRLDQRMEFVAEGKRPSPTASPLGALSRKPATAQANPYEQLKLNDAVTYSGQDFLVTGHILYKVASGNLHAFLLEDRNEKHWLRIGPNQEMAVMTEVSFGVPAPLPQTLAYQGQTYTRADEGAANVTVEGASGTKTGAANFTRYTGDGGKRLWVEDWGTETKVQVGQVVDPFEVKLYRKL